MRQGKFAVVLSVLGALILVVAACAPAATPTPTPTPTPTVTPTPGVATPTPTPVPGEATPTPAPEAPPQYGGVLRKGGSLIAYYDCHFTISLSCVTPSAFIFSALVRYRAGIDTYKFEYLEGDLAERWEISADQKVYTFYLRRGVKFHDGVPFTAKDVKYSLEKLQDPKRSAFANLFSVMERIELVDDYTVKVYLKYPSGLFLPYLAQGMSDIQPEHLKAVNYRTAAFAIGTGAFKLKTSTSMEFIVEKNPDFHFKGRPYLDGVAITTMDDTARLNAFIGKRIDMGPDYGIDASLLEIIRRLAPEAIIRYQPAWPAVRGIVFSFAREGPWQDVRVRKAMTLVSDFEGAALAAYGGLREMADSRSGYFWGPELGGIGIPWEEKSKWWWQDRPLEARVAEAKRLMTAAGYSNGFKAELMLLGPQDYLVKPPMLHADLYKRYLNIDLAVINPGRTVAIERRERATFDIAFDSFVVTLGDPEQFLASIYTAGGAVNYGRYSHPMIAEILAKMQQETDPERRIALAHQAERILFDDIPLIPYFKSSKAKSMWPYVKGWEKMHPYHSDYAPTQERVWLDKNDPTWASRGG